MIKKDPFLRKISDLRCRYGDTEANHFLKNPHCFHGKEKRMAALTVHHVDGVKNSDVVITLCFNCHMVVHAPLTGGFTYADHLLRVQNANKIKSNRKKFHRSLFKAWQKCNNTRQVGREFGVSHVTVRNVIKSFSIPR